MSKRQARVFISWSGRRSFIVAEAIRQLLKGTLPKNRVRPFLYPSSVDAGVPTVGTIRDELERSSAGVFCLTEENRLEPWIMFEAGAISSRPDAPVIPYCIDDDRRLLASGPLRDGHFKPVRADENGTRDLVLGLAHAIGVSAPGRSTFLEHWKRCRGTIEGVRKAPVRVLTPRVLPSLHDDVWAIESRNDLPFHRWLRNHILALGHESIAEIRLQAEAGLRDRRHGWRNYDKAVERLMNRRPRTMLALCGTKGCSEGEKTRYYRRFYARARELAKSAPECVHACRMFVHPKRKVRRHLNDHNRPKRWNRGVRGLEVPRSEVELLEADYPGLRKQLVDGFGFVIFEFENDEWLVIAHEGSSNDNAFSIIEDEVSVREILVLHHELATRSIQAVARPRDRPLQELLDRLRTAGVR